MDRIALHDIVGYWGRQYRNESGNWVHPDDEETFARMPHTFNLDFPVSPFVGDILSAPVIILGANARYTPTRTPTEFPDDSAIEAYVNRVRNPSESDWSFVSRYYDKVSYGRLLSHGSAALINACPYRSPKISEEPDNRKVLKKLPSVRFTRQWLLDAVLPLAEQGERLVVAKRPGLWSLPPSVRQARGVVFDPAPRSPQITREPWSAVLEKLRKQA